MIAIMLRAGVVIALVAAAAAVTLAAVALGRHAPSPAPVTAGLEAQTSALAARLASTEAELGRMHSLVAKFQTCLPELNNEISGLSPNVSNGSVYLSQTSQVSAYCNALLTGTTGH